MCTTSLMGWRIHGAAGLGGCLFVFSELLWLAQPHGLSSVSCRLLTWSWNHTAAICSGTWAVCFRDISAFRTLKQDITWKVEIKKFIWHFFLGMLQDFTVPDTTAKSGFSCVSWRWAVIIFHIPHGLKLFSQPEVVAFGQAAVAGCSVCQGSAFPGLPRHGAESRMVVVREILAFLTARGLSILLISYLALYHDLVTLQSGCEFSLFITGFVKKQVLHACPQCGQKVVWNNVYHIGMHVIPLFQTVQIWGNKFPLLAPRKVQVYPFFCSKVLPGHNFVDSGIWQSYRWKQVSLQQSSGQGYV